ncbi:MAG: RdgB/HAM1 family non-canonical purine NTP pyrophosphatase [Actinomycetota bacterium]
MAAPLARLVLATGNPGKVEELSALLGARYEVEARPADLPETVEDGETLEHNARKKAVEVRDHAGALAVADDTGLFVDALNGIPGVRSARYAGEPADAAANVATLLAAMADVADGPARRAEFRTVIVAAWPDGSEVVVTGIAPGRIAMERSGEGGFGYDAVFVPDEGDGKTFAEMSAEAKNAISHRAKAIEALLGALD